MEKNQEKKGIHPPHENSQNTPKNSQEEHIQRDNEIGDFRAKTYNRIQNIRCYLVREWIKLDSGEYSGDELIKIQQSIGRLQEELRKHKWRYEQLRD
jgi:hypothetical protein